MRHYIESSHEPQPRDPLPFPDSACDTPLTPPYCAPPTPVFQTGSILFLTTQTLTVSQCHIAQCKQSTLLRTYQQLRSHPAASITAQQAPGVINHVAIAESPTSRGAPVHLVFPRRARSAAAQPDLPCPPRRCLRPPFASRTYTSCLLHSVCCSGKETAQVVHKPT